MISSSLRFSGLVNPFSKSAAADRDVNKQIRNTRKLEDQQRLEARERTFSHGVLDFNPEIRPIVEDYIAKEDAFVREVRELEDQALATERAARDLFEKTSKPKKAEEKQEKIKALQAKARQIREDIATRREEHASGPTLHKVIDDAIEDLEYW